MALIHKIGDRDTYALRLMPSSGCVSRCEGITFVL